ncbi:MAG: hypothetical protein AAF989_15010, partial [Planctomycetota bacterium]
MGCSFAQVRPAFSADDVIDGKPIATWVEQLGNDSYAYRERATTVLMNAGPVVIEPLARATKKGDFELVLRAIRILQSQAVKQDVAEEGGAMASLSLMAEEATGARGVAARESIAAIRLLRAQRAEKELTHAGIFIGRSTITETDIQPRMLVRIDGDWNGDLEALKWVRWINGIDTVLLRGEGCNDECLIAVCKMPSVARFHLSDGRLSNRALAALGNVGKIRELVFDYVQFDSQPTELIVSLSLVDRLRLFGTNLKSDQDEIIRAAFPS